MSPDGPEASVIFVYYGHPHDIKSGVDRVSSLLMEQFARRRIACHVAYRYGGGHEQDFAKPAGELRLPRERIDHKDNVTALSRYIRDHRIGLVINQGGCFLEVTRLCAAVKNRAPARLYSVVHNSPRRYLLTVASAMIAPGMGSGGRGRLRRLGLLCVNLALYFRAYVKSVKLLRFLYRSSDRTIVLSPSYVDEFLALARIKDREHRVRAIPNPLCPPPAFTESGAGRLRKKNVLYIGRMDCATKRVDLLLQVWRRVQDDLGDWSLLLLGDGKDGPALRAMADTLHLKNVRFIGHLDPQQYLRDGSILCLTSATEGFPMVLTEAQSWGVVPIAFASFGAVFDVIQDGVNGVLVTPFDCAQYAEKLISLARDEPRRAALSRNAMDASAKYSEQAIAGKWMELFAEDGLSNGRPRR